MTIKEVSTTTYLLEMKDGSQKKMTVPTSWKVTFGAAVPGKPGVSGYNDQSNLCFRLYEKANQRACILGAIAFRDTSIEVQELITETKTERVRRQTPEGEKDFLVEANIKEWRNPDKVYEVPTEFRALPPVKKED